jgi:hypothetical protein
VALVDLGRARGDPLASELTHEIADLALIFRQRFVRHAESLVSPTLQSAR